MKDELETPRMSVAERLELAKQVRLRAKVAKNDVNANIAQQLANVEAQLAARYDENHGKWADLTRHAKEAVKKADEELAKRCREMGIPEAFRPKLNLSWYGRGENGDKERRAELRNVAESELEAQAQKAKVAIEKIEVDQLTQITAEGLTSEAARQFLLSMPTVSQLMPHLQLEDLEKRRPLLSASLDDDD
jgi:hypothetical protein